MKKCTCGKEMKELVGKTPDGVKYNYFRCNSCGEEILDMKQLHSVAEQYRVMKKFNAKLSKWGLSVGLRIPKEILKRHNLKPNKDVFIIDEERGFRVVGV
jgi:DNA-directed RNA polymerase subunit RPC12/RpoP